jgi:hypothetical protein
VNSISKYVLAYEGKRSLLQGIVIFASIFLIEVYEHVYASTDPEQIQTDINATNVYNTGKMVLDDSIKRLVILIPNEASEGLTKPRYYPQPFIPQDAVVSPGTEVVWFNGDLAHPYAVVVTNTISKTEVAKIPQFGDMNLSNPFSLNDIGKFEYANTYFDPDDLFSSPDEVGFIVNGTITVVDRRTNDTTAEPFDTVGALMVPSNNTHSVAMNLKNAGFGIDSMYEFQDLYNRGDRQVLIVWTTNGVDLNKIESTLQTTSKALPYE